MIQLEINSSVDREELEKKQREDNMNKPDIPKTGLIVKLGIVYMKTITFLFIILIIQLTLLFFAIESAKAKRPEKLYQDMYCEGITEYV